MRKEKDMSKSSINKKNKMISHDAPQHHNPLNDRYRKKQAERYYTQPKLRPIKYRNDIKLTPSRADLVSHMPLYDVNYDYSRNVLSGQLSKKGLFLMSLLVLPSIISAVTIPEHTFNSRDIFSDLNGVSFRQEMIDRKGSTTLSFSANHVDSLSVDTSYTSSTAISTTPLSRSMTFTDLESVSQRNVFEGAIAKIKTGLQSEKIKAFKHESLLHGDKLVAESNNLALEQETTLKKLESVSLDTKTENDEFIRTNALNASHVGFFSMKEKRAGKDKNDVVMKNELSKKTVNLIKKDTDKKTSFKKETQDPLLGESQKDEVTRHNQQSSKFFSDRINEYDHRITLREEIIKGLGGEKAYAKSIIDTVFKGDLKYFHEQVGLDKAKRYLQMIDNDKTNSYYSNLQHLLHLSHVFQPDIIAFQPSTLEYMLSELKEKRRAILEERYYSPLFSKTDLLLLNDVMLNSIHAFVLSNLSNKTMRMN